MASLTACRPHFSVHRYFIRRRDHGGLVAGGTPHRGRDRAGEFEQVAGLDHAGERLLDAFHLADRDVELRADAGIGGCVAQHALGGRGRRSRERDCASGGEACHQHPPALAGAVGPADDPFGRDENVLPPDRSVREGVAAWQMTAADGDAGVIMWQQRQRDAEILALAEKVFRGRTAGTARPTSVACGAEGDVALVPRRRGCRSPLCPRAGPSSRSRRRAWWRHRSRRSVRSGRSRALPGPWRGAADSGASARACRISRSARRARASSAP